MPAIYEILTNLLDDKTVVHHTAFDRIAFHRSAAKHALNPPAGKWLDSAAVARRTWEDCAYGGYGLFDLANMLGIQFRHHEASEDARAAGEVMVKAIEVSGLDLDAWHERVREPLGWFPHRDSRPTRTASPNSEFTGETVVFTGKLERLYRDEGADLAAAAGFNVEPGVTKRTTILVVGEQHLRRLRGDGKSSKHLKAEKLSAAGQSIRIIGEADFLELVGKA